MNQHALKEWASVCEALEKGRQVVLLRKGGIEEPDGTFRVAHPEFFLFPTFVHQRPELLKPEARAWLADTLARREEPASLRLTLYATVEDAYPIAGLAELEALDPEHVLTPAYATERLRWKPRQPLWVLVPRVYRVMDPPLLVVTAQHRGCASWIDLGPTVGRPAPDRLVPVQDDDAFRTSVARVARNASEMPGQA